MLTGVERNSDPDRNRPAKRAGDGAELKRAEPPHLLICLIHTHTAVEPRDHRIQRAGTVRAGPGAGGRRLAGGRPD